MAQRFSVRLFCVLLLAGYLGAQKVPDTIAHYLESTRLRDIEKPLRMRGRFKVVVDAGSFDGEFSFVQDGRRAARNEIEIGDYREVILRNENRLWNQRSYTQPLRVNQLLELLAALNHRLKPDDEFSELKADKARYCSQLKNKSFKLKQKWCFIGTDVVEISAEYESGKERKLYSDYSEFAGKRFPRSGKYEDKGKVLVEFSDVTVQDASIDSATFSPLAGVVAEATCDSPVVPKPINTPDPHYTDEARAARLKGETVFLVKISDAGKVLAAEPVQMLGKGLQQNASEAIKTWTFRPAMCNGVPIPYEVKVAVNFDLY
jgi:TonB family protein